MSTRERMLGSGCVWSCWTGFWRVEMRAFLVGGPKGVPMHMTEVSDPPPYRLMTHGETEMPGIEEIESEPKLVPMYRYRLEARTILGVTYRFEGMS